MTWTPDADQRLLTLRREHPEASASQLADLLYEQGIDVSKDSVQKRLKRLRAEQHETTPPVPEAEVGFTLPEPEDGFVGFRLAFWDTESTGLTAIMGTMLTAGFADSWGNVTIKTIKDFPQTSMLDDSGLCEWLRDELEKFDVLVSWCGFGHDVPLLNARLARWGKRPLNDKMQIDAMWKAGGGRYGLRVGSRKLDNVAKFFRTKEAKTEIDWDVWKLAGMGDDAALAEVYHHNYQDVLVTREVFQHLKPMVRTVHR